MATKKHLQFKPPYIHSTFNENNNMIIGQNGVMFGMEIEKDGVDIIVKKGAYSLNGMIVEETSDILLTPTLGVSPLYLLVTTISAHTDDPSVFVFTSELSEIPSNAVVIARYNGSEWTTSEKLSISEIITERQKQNLHVSGKGVYNGFISSVNDVLTDIELTSGYLIDGLGVRCESGEDSSYSIGDTDLDFPRRDLIVYRRPQDDWRKPGTLERVVGTTYSTNYYDRIENIKEDQVTSTLSDPHIDARNFADSSNGLSVLWINNNNLYYAKYNSARTLKIVPATLIESGITEFDALMDSSDNIHIVGVISNNIIYKKINNGGATVIGASLIDTQPNVTSNPTIGVDYLGAIYIIYSHVLAPTGFPTYNRQLYFTKLNSDGSVNIIPKRLMIDSSDYITPKITVDTTRQTHCVFENTVDGRIIYYILDSEGVVLTITTLSDDTGGNFGAGYYETFGLTDAEKPEIKISNVGDIYICWIQERNGTGGKRSLILYHESFKVVNGFKAIALGFDNKDLGFGEGGYGVRGYGRDLVNRTGTILTDEDIDNPFITIDGYHNVHIATDAQLYLTEAKAIWHVKMSNDYFVNTRKLAQLGPFKLKYTTTPSDTFTNPCIEIDKTGSISTVWQDGSNIFVNKSNAGVFVEGFVESDAELWLSEFTLPAGSISYLRDINVTSREHNKLSDRINKITVGINETSGDFVGDHGIKEALECLKGFGGTIELLSGNYKVGNTYEIYSGIQLIGLGKVTIEKISGPGAILSMTGKVGTITSMATSSFDDQNTDFRAKGFLVGDTVDLLDATDNLLQRTRIIGIDGSGGVGGLLNIRIHTSDDVDVLATKYIVYRTGANIRNIEIAGADESNNIDLNYISKCNVKDCKSRNSTFHGISIQNAITCVIQNNICEYNTLRGIYVNDCKLGYLSVISNICRNNSTSSDNVDVEFTINTQDNLVIGNKGALLDSGSSNQPDFYQPSSISIPAFEDFVAATKLKYPDANGAIDNPYNIDTDSDGSVRDGFYFLKTDSLDYDLDGNYYIVGKTPQIIIPADNSWDVTYSSQFQSNTLSTRSKNNKIGISYYGTGIIMLARMGSSAATTLTKTHDGNIESFSLTGSRGFLDDGITPIVLFSDQDLDKHYVEVIRDDDSSDKVLEILGFIIIHGTNALNIVHVNKSNTFISGSYCPHEENVSLTVPALTENARTDCVVATQYGVYELIQGSPIPILNEEYLSGVDVTRPMEEISIRLEGNLPEVYQMEELGDLSTDNSNFIKSSYIDDTLSLWATNADVKVDTSTLYYSSLRLESADAELHLLCKGTGLAIDIGVIPGVSGELISVYIDDSYKGDISAPISTSDINFIKIDIFANMTDSSHHIVFKSKTGNTLPCLYLQRIHIYRAKRSLVVGKRRIATLRNKPNSSAYIISNLYKTLVPVGGSFIRLTPDVNRLAGESLELTGSLGDYFEIPFYGKGVKIYFKEEVGSSRAEVYIDGLPPSSLGAIGSPDEIAVGTVNVDNQSAYWELPEQGYHVLKIIPTTGSALFKPNAVGVLPGTAFDIQQQRKTSAVSSDITRLK